MPSFTFTLLFASALCLSVLVKLWLASRQIQCVALRRNEVPAAFVDTVSPRAHQKAADYTIAKARLSMLTTLWGAAILLAWTLLGGLNFLNGWLRETIHLSWGPMVYQLSLLTCFTLLSSLLEAPFDLYGTFRIEQQFGFNRMTWRLVLTDTIKGLVVGAMLGLPLTALVLWLMAQAGAMWWLWAWVAWSGFSLLMMVVYPLFIAPLFNRFEPLGNEPIKLRVEALMKRCGFASKGLFVMDGSKRSAHANAYFTGFGAAKRVVFFDTLLNKLSPPEVEAVLAHELGHFKCRHTLKRMLSMFAISLAGLALLGWLSNQAWFYQGLGVQPSMSAPNDALALLLFIMGLPVLGYFVAPLSAFISRRHEFEADAYACTQTSPRDLATALLKLYEDNAATLTPDPVYARFYYSHPPASERLAALARMAT